jgi:hypothetical protein
MLPFLGIVLLLIKFILSVYIVVPQPSGPPFLTLGASKHTGPARSHLPTYASLSAIHTVLL